MNYQLELITPSVVSLCPLTLQWSLWNAFFSLTDRHRWYNCTNGGNITGTFAFVLLSSHKSKFSNEQRWRKRCWIERFSSVDQVVFHIYRHVFRNNVFKRFLNGWILKGRDRYGSNVGGKEKRRSQKPWRESKTLDHAWPHWIPFSRSKDAVMDIVTHRLSLVTLDFYIVYFPTIFPRLFSSFELFRTSEHDNLPINIISDSTTN